MLQKARKVNKVTTSDRSAAQWRDLLFSRPILEMFFDRVVMGLWPTEEDENRADQARLALYQGTTLVVP